MAPLSHLQVHQRLQELRAEGKRADEAVGNTLGIVKELKARGIADLPAPLTDDWAGIEELLTPLDERLTDLARKLKPVITRKRPARPTGMERIAA